MSGFAQMKEILIWAVVDWIHLQSADWKRFLVVMILFCNSLFLFWVFQCSTLNMACNQSDVLNTWIEVFREVQLLKGSNMHKNNRLPVINLTTGHPAKYFFGFENACGIGRDWMKPSSRNADIRLESDNSIVINIFNSISFPIRQSRHRMDFLNSSPVHERIWTTTIWYHSRIVSLARFYESYTMSHGPWHIDVWSPVVWRI